MMTLIDVYLDFAMYPKLLPNETVEKPKFRKPPPVRRSDFHRRQGQNGVTGSK
jgi:hypothetical protein